MKTLFTLSLILFSLSSIAQTFRGMRKAEYNLLSRYQIDYASPWARYLFSDKTRLKNLDQSEKKSIALAVDKFSKWNKWGFNLCPINSVPIMSSDDFYYQGEFIQTCSITGYARIPINKDRIEYIEIVEFIVDRAKSTDYEFLILIKYEMQPVEHYWDSTFYDDCGQCDVAN